MKTKIKRNRKNKAKSTFLLMLIYGIALFFANISIDRVRVMSPEEFWGMFQSQSKTIVIENVSSAATMTQEEAGTVEAVDDVPEPVEYPYSAKLTAYNSVPEQTDGNPCMSADGTDLCKFDGCAVAQNGVKFGTIIEIEGIGKCEVHDRKNSRYGKEWIDIYFGGRDKVPAARAFGTKEARYRVID